MVDGVTLRGAGSVTRAVIYLLGASYTCTGSTHFQLILKTASPSSHSHPPGPQSPCYHLTAGRSTSPDVWSSARPSPLPCRPVFLITERDRCHSGRVRSPPGHIGPSSSCAQGLPWPWALALTLGPLGSSPASLMPPHRFFLGDPMAFPAIFIFVFESPGCAKVPAHFLPGSSTD